MAELSDAAEEKFCKLVATGMSQSTAYGRCGWRKDSSNAAKLASRPHIAQRIAELRVEDAERERMRLAEVGILPGAEELRRALAGAYAAEQWGPAVSAARHLAELDGSGAQLAPSREESWEDVMAGVERQMGSDPLYKLAMVMLYVKTSFEMPDRSEEDIKTLQAGLGRFLNPKQLHDLGNRLLTMKENA